MVEKETQATLYEMSAMKQISDLKKVLRGHDKTYISFSFDNSKN